MILSSIKFLIAAVYFGDFQELQDNFLVITLFDFHGCSRIHINVSVILMNNEVVMYLCLISLNKQSAVYDLISELFYL